ncbi:973_t:CDS:2 [Ambispora gerdemannii]|uniref:973_t:CDS:1 n=1 Tax=Ambispora gerdemannii TaxID=144530 RepID=A0A9N9G7J9_9GLOM|nr:973_t:CDS:2 [Ambispora gerdemannii]
MEVNKDEALRCLQIAKNHLSLGNLNSARKFTKKSISLYPTPDAKTLLKTIESTSFSEIDENEAPASSFSSSREHIQGRQPRDYTPEQSEAVKRIRNCGVYEYYEVLGLDKDASDADIKKAYKKLALLMHPDKNGAPGADEAFKMISKAFQVLNDPQKRKLFDEYGADPDSRGTNLPNQDFVNSRYKDFSNGMVFTDEITPEELFEMFFGGRGFNSATYVGRGFRGGRFTTTRRTSPPNGEDDQTTPGWLQLFQLLPLILLFIFSFSSSLFNSSQDQYPTFSLQRNPPYTEQRFTHSFQIPYFVNPNDFNMFEQNPRILRRYEEAVETSYVKQLQQYCNSEKIVQKQKLNEALGWYINLDERKLEEAKKMKMPNCEKLNELAELVSQSR